MKKPQPKLKKAARKAAWRRALAHPATPSRQAESKPPSPRQSAQLREENQKLHATAEAAARDARGLEKLMERSRWSRS